MLINQLSIAVIVLLFFLVLLVLIVEIVVLGVGYLSSLIVPGVTVFQASVLLALLLLAGSVLITGMRIGDQLQHLAVALSYEDDEDDEDEDDERF
jgi:hypothetical protein